MEILTIILVKIKYFLAGLVTGGLLHYFEIQVYKDGVRFNFGKFFTTCLILGFLTEFSRMVVFGWLMRGEINDDKAMVLSVCTAIVLYLFIPFILRPENRSAFFLWTIQKFGVKVDAKIEQQILNNEQK